MRRQITLAEVLTSFGGALKASMYHTLPGVVKAFYASDGTADIQPAVNDVRFDVDTQARTSEPFPIIPKVKVLYPSGGGFSITWPLSVGSKVTLHAYDLDPTVHRQTGNVEDPADVRRHGGTYWMAIPGDVTDQGLGATAGQIVIDGPGITLGAGATSFVALATLVATELGKIAATLATGSNSGGPVVFASPYTPGSVAATVVKAK